MTYDGIASDMLFLLAENRFRDSKAYYEEHKKELQEGVVSPLRRLIADLAPTMLTIDPRLNVDPMKNGCVSRVRRDTRYTHDKLMYRENMWIAFMRDKQAWNWCLPAFYLDFSIRGAEWGLGFYSATPAILRLIRQQADAEPDKVIAAVEQAQKAGFRPEGQPYARPRSTDATPAALKPLFDCKNINFTRTEAPDFVAGGDLPERLIAGYTALAPIYGILIGAVEKNMLG